MQRALRLLSTFLLVLLLAWPVGLAQARDGQQAPCPSKPTVEAQNVCVAPALASNTQRGAPSQTGACDQPAIDVSLSAASVTPRATRLVFSHADAAHSGFMPALLDPPPRL